MKRRRQQSFTLLELLVAMAISAVLVVLIAQIAAQVLGTWRAGSRRLTKNMDARTALELMAQDIQSAMIRPALNRNGYEWFRKEIDTGLGSGGYTANNVARLAFFTIGYDRAAPASGNIRAVVYRLGYEDPIASASGNPVKLFGLYRTQATAAETFNSILGQTNLWSGYWQNIETRDSTNFLIPHVIDFRAILRVRNPDGSTVETPHDSVATLGDVLSVTPAMASIKDGATLEAIDISIKLINEETAKKIQANTGPIDRLISQNSLIYARRVLIRYAP